MAISKQPKKQRRNWKGADPVLMMAIPRNIPDDRIKLRAQRDDGMQAFWSVVLLEWQRPASLQVSIILSEILAAKVFPLAVVSSSTKGRMEYNMFWI
jgi:hypothetical protein